MPGKVIAMGTARSGGEPIEPQELLRVVPGRGVVGDRYSADLGFFKGHPDMDVTLVEAEDAEAVGFEPLVLRRNIVTRGVSLESLIGKPFRLGTAILHGMRPCLPCGYLSNMLGTPDLPARFRGGLRARVVQAGDIRVGDEIVPLDDGPTIDADMRAVVESAHLAFVATVTPEGRPNLSPKGTIRVLDDRRLFYLDIASHQTRKNLKVNAWMEINVVDTISRRGYRFLGRAAAHRDDDVYREATKRVFDEEGVEYRAEAVIVLTVERAIPLVSPGYRHVETEEEMREGWKVRRAKLDEAFEAHLASSPDTLS